MTGANTDGASLTVSSSQSDYNSWIVIPVTATTSTGSFLVDTSDNSVAVKDIAESITGLTFIDDRGQAQTLTEICRNDDLHIKVYVHYTPSSAVLYFQVKAWNNVNNETTFD